jgi:hypothetical protein
VADQVNMKSVHAAGRQLRLKRIVRAGFAELFANQTDAVRDAKNVRVHGQNGPPERKQQHACGGFWPNAGKTLQVSTRLLGGQVT